jgi:hypothetical protein
MNQEFQPFGKIPRLMREIVVTEKIDGTNASVHIGEDGSFQVASRTKWITPEDDNYGFAKWAYANKEELMQLGPGAHFGEWWGLGIQRNYGLKEKRFSLFNVGRWTVEAPPPACCSVVPVLYSGVFSQVEIEAALQGLKDYGSMAASCFMKPEGVIVYHVAAGQYFKQTIEKDEEWKGKSAQ